MAINLKGIKNVDKDKLINSTKKDIDILGIKGVAALAKATNPTALSADIVAYYASNSSSDGIRPNSDNRTDTGSMVTSSSGGGGTSFATAETAADSNTPKADELAAEDFKKMMQP